MKKYISTIVVAVVFLAAGAFGGYKYAQSKTPAAPQRGASAFGAGRGGGRFGNGNDFVNGTILSNDNGSLTVQMRALPGAATSTNSGSKIVILSGNTQIYKSVQGTPTDLTVGENITATGVDSSTGAMTAQTIQIRQMMPSGQGTPGGQPNQSGQTPPSAGN